MHRPLGAQAMSELLAGTRMTKVTERKTKIDWARFLADIAGRYQDATTITLVMDNLSTHQPGALYKACPPDEAKALWDRFEFVYTPRHGSWLNVAEVELNVMIGQCLNRRIDCIEVLRREVVAWQASRDRIQAKVDWQFTTHDARGRVDGVVTEPRPPQSRTCASNASGSSHDSFAQGWAACRRMRAGGRGYRRRMSVIRSQFTRSWRLRRESHFLQVWVTS